MRDPEFLSWEVVEQLHDDSLQLWGGTPGVRDRGQLESALGAAQFTWLYGGSTFDTAAAYAFHIAEARAFVDANKRTGVAAALLFLAGCGHPRFVDDGRLYKAMIDVAARQLDKKGLAELLRSFVEVQK
jgi:death-on-curing protein